MKRTSKVRGLGSFFLLFSLFLAAASASAGAYPALHGVKTVKAVIDFRISEPASALMHLNLIRQMFTDKDLRAISAKPSFVVVFIGPSVHLISKNREGLAPDRQKALDEIASTVSAMAKEGIGLEVCLAAAQAFGVDPASFPPEIKPVANGWISLIGYESRGYALVPAY